MRSIKAIQTEYKVISFVQGLKLAGRFSLMPVERNGNMSLRVFILEMECCIFRIFSFTTAPEDVRKIFMLRSKEK